MGRPLSVVVVGESESAALRVAADLEQCGYEPSFTRVRLDTDLGAYPLGSHDVIVAARLSSSPLPERMLQDAARRGLAVLVHSDGYTEDEIVSLMRAGARDCLRRGDLRRIGEAVERELEAGRRRVTAAPPLPVDAEAGDTYRALIEEIPALTYVAWADQVGSRAYVSPQLVAMTGFAPAEWMAEPDLWSRRLHPDDRERVLREFRDACAAGGSFGCEYRIVDSAGRELWWRDEGRVVRDGEGRARFVRGFVLDVTEQKLAEESLRRHRFYDQLTGLPNREFMTNQLGRDLAAAARGERPVAVIILALDNFREVVNTLGHHNGDLVVRELAARLGESVGDASRIARLRGDEFGVLLPDAGAPLALQVGKRILTALEPPFMVHKLPIEISASVGVSLAPDHGTEAELLLRRADAAVQAARRLGGGECVVYSPEYEPYDPSRLALLGELRRALAGNELLLYYQPKVDLKTHAVVGAEALLRWPHPKRGMVAPTEFVPLAEQTGLIRPLTRWVLERAAADTRVWEKAGHTLPVAVNVSPRSLHDAHILSDVKEALAAHEMAPQRLQIEVTESAVMADESRAVDVLRQLTSTGVAVSIDDFGTGYSSLALLRRLPVSELKIDKSFVMGMAGDTGGDTAIVRSTSDLAHSLELSVVAEGVENQWTLDLLTTFDCDLAQGFFIARPMPAGDMTGWIDRSPWKTVEG